MTLAVHPMVTAGEMQRLPPSLLALLELARSRPERYTLAAAGRSYYRKVELYSWGRTARNPDMDRTGDPGLKGLGVTATNVRPDQESAHDFRADGLAYGVDLWSADGNAALAAEARALGLDVEWGGEVVDLGSGRMDVNHFQARGWRSVPADPAATGGESVVTEAGASGGGGAVVVLLGLVVAGLVLGVAR